MRKRVLLAEQSDATRSVAETILRQNGFEVVSVADGARAAEVLAHGRPDLIIAGADLSYSGRPLYEQIRQNKASASIPLLLFATTGGGSLPIAAEQIIPRPFDPREFLDRVQVFVGAAATARPAQGAKGEMSVDDDFLDSALGVDTGGIHITDSEILDRTTKLSSSAQARKGHASHSEGFGLGQRDNDELSETGRVESLTINDSQTDIRRPKTEKTVRPAEPTDSGLEILENQYDLQGDDFEGAADREHDYQWFIDSMRDDVIDSPGKPGKKKPTADVADDLVFTDTADTLEPFRMPVENKPAQPAAPPVQPAAKKDGAGVEKFIDEFKKEIEKFHAEEPESVTLRSESPTKPISDAEWEETLESITPEKVELFTRRLAADLAERIAERIVSKIDSAKLLQLIKTEIMNELRSRRKA